MDGLENYVVMFPKNLFFRMAEQRRDRLDIWHEKSPVTESMVEYMRNGFLGTVRFLYEEGKSFLFDLDFGVGKILGMKSFGAADMSILLDLMKSNGIVDSDAYPYRLNSNYEKAFDLLFMQRMLS